MRRSVKILLAAAAALVVLAVAGVVVFVQRGSDAPAPPELSAPEDAAPERAEPRATGDGVWDVAGGFLGYRVRESLAGIGATTAVGRTRAVSGRVTVREGRAVEGRISADLRQLTSDEPRRDARIRSDGLESDRFPRATFELERPAAIGRPAPARGRLTLHGVTRPIAMSIRSAVLERAARDRRYGADHLRAVRHGASKHRRLRLGPPRGHDRGPPDPRAVRGPARCARVAPRPRATAARIPGA